MICLDPGKALGGGGGGDQNLGQAQIISIFECNIRNEQMRVSLMMKLDSWGRGDNEPAQRFTRIISCLNLIIGNEVEVEGYLNSK